MSFRDYSGNPSEADAPGTPSRKKRHVWVVNHYAAIPSKDGGAGRHLELAWELEPLGWSTSLIVSSTSHPSGRQKLKGVRRTKLTVEGGVPALWIKTNAYARSTFLRFIGMGVFALNLLLPGATRRLERPDIVVGSTVHPLAAWAGLKLSKRHRVPFIFEIRDVWPDSLVDLGALRNDGVPARAMLRLITYLARSADLVLSPLPFVDRFLTDNGLHNIPFRWVSNGAEVPDSVEPTLNIREASTFTFMYLGAHGNANALGHIIRSFDRACRERSDLNLALRLIGDGPLKPELIELAQSLACSNRVTFEDPIPKQLVPETMSEADCMVAAVEDLPVYKYGIALNKLFSYMASGQPTVFASSAPNNPIRDASCGIVVRGDDEEAFAGAMTNIVDTPIEERQKMAQRGIKHLESHYSFEALAVRLADVLAETMAIAHGHGLRNSNV